jgi:hypothetical protein
MSDLPHYQDFVDHIDSDFTMFLEDGTSRTVRLRKVSDLLSRPPQTQFSLIFNAPQDTPLVQQIYKLEHGVLGTMELFLVPVAQDEIGIRFQAVFNQIS